MKTMLKFNPCHRVCPLYRGCMAAPGRVRYGKFYCTTTAVEMSLYIHFQTNRACEAPLPFCCYSNIYHDIMTSSLEFASLLHTCMLMIRTL